ncbi:hypothetical protein AB0E08_08310 [Streptomyces sp. NPDC048281]|uniref:hypothetical protein n=1 Tax=Streptomyces sp. NPDC048281 TaxID=3154715 RepID=UPI00342F9F49
MGTSERRKQAYLAKQQAKNRATPEPAALATAQPEPEPAPQQAPAAPGELQLDMDLDFGLPPMDLLFAEGASPHSPPKTVVLGPPLEAHWRKFLLANPDLKQLTKFMRAALRLTIREWEASAAVAREEMKRVRVPVQPEAGPLLQALRAEYQMVVAEEAAERAEARRAAALEG